MDQHSVARSPKPRPSPSASPSPYAAQTLLRQQPQQHIVDFSYSDLKSHKQLRHAEPRQGVLYVHPAVKAKLARAKAVANPNNQTLGEVVSQAETDRKAKLYYFGDRGGGKTEVTEDGIHIVRAKDESYAFKETQELPDGIDESMSPKIILMLDTRTETLERFQRLYKCTALSLSRNSLTTLDQFGESLRWCLFRPTQFLVSLDLSGNQLQHLHAELLAFTQLHTLLLHTNQLADEKELALLQPLHGTLRHFTAMDNPWQTSLGKLYRPRVLTILPFVSHLDKSIVTGPEKEQLARFVDVFVPPRERDAARHRLVPERKRTAAGDHSLSAIPSSRSPSPHRQ